VDVVRLVDGGLTTLIPRIGPQLKYDRMRLTSVEVDLRRTTRRRRTRMAQLGSAHEYGRPSAAAAEPNAKPA
jgi:hypothetical protein